jgi:3-hydroxyacyl-CoA dehydrogenase
VGAGKLGDKTGGGFYTKTPQGTLTFDWRTRTYVPQQRLEGGELGALIKLPVAQRLAAARQLPGAHGDFLRAHLVEVAHYTLQRTPELAHDIPAVDRAMEWGYGFEAGPFRVIDALGVAWLRGEFAARGLAEPPLLAQLLAAGGTSFYRGDEVFGFDGAYHPLPAVPGRVSLAGLAAAGKVLADNGVSRLVDLGDGVACFEFRSKMNSLGQGVLEGLVGALETVDRLGYHGMVIGNEDPRAFSVGADLAAVAFGVSAGMWDELAESCRAFQQAVQAVRRAPFPVVAATAGMALGGGCEFAMHADAVQPHAETYMGLVEAGVGLLPGGGGTTELLFRFTTALAPYDDVDAFAAVARAFKLIAFATTSTSAAEARALGLLRDSDRISMNRDRHLADAKARVLELAPGYLPPLPRTIRALGREGMGNLAYGLWAAQEAGQASAHDVRVGTAIATVLCGGDGAPRMVTEQDILDLEREQFLSLLGTAETQARIAHTLKTGKPLRN